MAPPSSAAAAAVAGNASRRGGTKLGVKKEAKKEEKKEKSQEALTTQVLGKILRELRRQDPPPVSVSTKAIGDAINTIVGGDEGWLKNVAHWQDSRCLASFRSKSEHHGLSLKAVGFVGKPVTAASTSAAKKGGQGGGAKEGKKEGKWEEGRLQEEEWDAPVITKQEVVAGATGVAMATVADAVNLLSRIGSEKPLAIVIPGHFNPETWREKELVEALGKTKWAHKEVLYRDSSTKGMVFRRATIIQLGKGAVSEKEADDEGLGEIAKDAIREICVSAVKSMMTATDVKSAESDVAAFLGKAASEVVSKARQKYGMRVRDTHVEMLLSLTADAAAVAIDNQRGLNEKGIFVREVLRPGITALPDRSLIWLEKGANLKDALAKATEIGPEAVVAWRPAGLGIRFSDVVLAKARTVLLKSHQLPTAAAIAVKGKHAWLIEGLPHGCDLHAVAELFAVWGWPVIADRKCKGGKAVRVFADSNPKHLSVRFTLDGKSKKLALRREVPLTDEEEVEEVEESDEDAVKEVDGDGDKAMDTTPLPAEGAEGAGREKENEAKQNDAKGLPPTPAPVSTGTSSTVTPSPTATSARQAPPSGGRVKGGDTRPAEKDGALETMRREWETRFAKMESDLADSRTTQQQYQAATEAKIVAIGSNLTEHAEKVSAAFGSATARANALETMMAQLLAQQKTTNDCLATLASDKRRKTDDKEEEGLGGAGR
jgi:hypothetical protein